MTKKAKELIKERGLKKKSLKTADKAVVETLCDIVNKVSCAQVRSDAGIDIDWKRIADQAKESAQSMITMLNGNVLPVDMKHKRPLYS